MKINNLFKVFYATSPDVIGQKNTELFKLIIKA